MYKINTRSYSRISENVLDIRLNYSPTYRSFTIRDLQSAVAVSQIHAHGNEKELVKKKKTEYHDRLRVKNRISSATRPIRLIYPKLRLIVRN